MYKCPFPGCNFRTDSWGGLKRHVGKIHRVSRCPVCGRSYRHLTKHLEVASRADDKHAVFYALMRRGKWGEGRTDNYHRCVKIAEKYCEVEE